MFLHGHTLVKTLLPMVGGGSLKRNLITKNTVLSSLSISKWIAIHSLSSEMPISTLFLANSLSSRLCLKTKYNWSSSKRGLGCRMSSFLEKHHHGNTYCHLVGTPVRVWAKDCIMMSSSVENYIQSKYLLVSNLKGKCFLFFGGCIHNIHV